MELMPVTFSSAAPTSIYYLTLRILVLHLVTHLHLHCNIIYWGVLFFLPSLTEHNSYTGMALFALKVSS